MSLVLCNQSRIPKNHPICKIDQILTSHLNSFRYKCSWTSIKSTKAKLELNDLQPAFMTSEQSLRMDSKPKQTLATPSDSWWGSWRQRRTWSRMIWRWKSSMKLLKFELSEQPLKLLKHLKKFKRDRCLLLCPPLIKFEDTTVIFCPQ